jgi:chemotaxis protein MotB
VNRRNKRAQDHPHANHERWLISYADFITLLFAFFVVMYAASRGKQSRVMALQQAIRSAFAELGMFTPASPKLNLVPAPPAEVVATARILAPLAELKARLARELASEIASQAVSLELTRQGLVVRLEEAGFFDSGSDALRPGAAPVLAKIAAAVAPLPNMLRFQGHTDNVPIHNTRFASNWQLSTARAVELVRMFIHQYKIDPQRLSAAGYAQYHPIASNATPQGRQMNRRVDLVVVAGDADQLPALPPALAPPGGAKSAAKPAASQPPAAKPAHPLPVAATRRHPERQRASVAGKRSPATARPAPGSPRRPRVGVAAGGRRQQKVAVPRPPPRPVPN